MKIKRFILAGALCSLAFVALTAETCNSQTKGADQIKNDQQDVGRQQDIYSKSQPVPIFDYSQVRASLIQIYQAKAKAVSTFTVVTSFTGSVLFTCESIGFPIPADTQLTNPSQVTRIGVGGDHFVDGTLPQAEPDGTYTSQNTDGTYVLCVRPGGQVAPVYTEAKATAFTFPVKVENGRIVDAGGNGSVSVDVR